MKYGWVKLTSISREKLLCHYRYVYEGRGWKLLLVLNTILSNAAVDLPFLREEDGKEFVDLLISLYQVLQMCMMFNVLR